MWRGDSNSSRRWLSSASVSASASLKVTRGDPVRSMRPRSYRRSRGSWGALSPCLFHLFREVTRWIHMLRVHRDTKSAVQTSTARSRVTFASTFQDRPTCTHHLIRDAQSETRREWGPCGSPLSA